jgi:hypothetical protein
MTGNSAKTEAVFAGVPVFVLAYTVPFGLLTVADPRLAAFFYPGDAGETAMCYNKN